jgi:F-type H+-transporting ATPase subunit alpha
MLDFADIAPGQSFFLTQSMSQLYIGNHLFGRVINPLTDPKDDLGALPLKNKDFDLSTDAGTVEKRERISKQLHTGYGMTDIVLPIGVGQRQLLMGPTQSGADSFAQEVVLQQGGLDNVVCIYVLIGKHPATIFRVSRNLFETPAQKNTIILATTSRDMAPLHALAPMVAVQIAEYFSLQNKDVLIVIDDMYTHAKYLREIALLEGRLPGRESYPGDIFFQQAHLMERAGCFVGRGSITFLPILQTNPEGYNDLITTNIMGTTDGHLLFSPILYAQGVFPSIVHDESVTRVGKHTQMVLHKQLSETVSVALAHAKEQERLSQFGQVAGTARTTLEIGLLLNKLLSQTQGARLSIKTQTILLALPFTTFLDAGLNMKNSASFETLVEYVQSYASSSGFYEKFSTLSTLQQLFTWMETDIVPSCKKICQN